MRKTPFCDDVDEWQFSAYSFFNFCSIASQNCQMSIQRCIQDTLQPKLDCVAFQTISMAMRILPF